MKADAQLRDEIEAELEWDPSFDSRRIGVAVKDGIVTLSGHVNAYVDRWAAQKAAQKVTGVRAIANEIQVSLSFDDRRSDTDIAEAALLALNGNTLIPADAIKVSVKDGWLTLDGRVSWYYQKYVTETTVSHLRGVQGITNNLVIASPAVKTSATDIKRKIESAFQRHAHRNVDRIHVSVTDGTVTLEGEVPSWREREDAQAAAWAAPGISKVEDRLIIRP